MAYAALPPTAPQPTIPTFMACPRAASHRHCSAAACSPGISRAVSGGHVHHEVEHLRGVSPLVVIPGNQLHESIVQCDACPGIEDTRAGFADEIGGDDGIFRVSDNSLKRTLRCSFHSRLDVFIAGWFGQAAREMTTDTSAIGTRNDIPVSFPFSSGMTFP